MRLDQVVEQIPPAGVHGFDQRELLLARPAFDLLFASDCVRHCRVHFVPDQQLAAVAERETRNGNLAMLKGATGQVGGDTSVEGTVAAARHHVNGGLLQGPLLFGWWVRFLFVIARRGTRRSNPAPACQSGLLRRLRLFAMTT